jgi:hypothetical protein
MNKIFLNKKAIKYTDFIWTFLTFIIAAIIWSFWANLMTWSKPQLDNIIEVIKISSIVFVAGTLILIIRKHLISIYIDSENNVLIITQLRVFQNNLQTNLNIHKLEISELKNEWFTYFNLKDDKSLICISSSNYGLSKKNVQKIHKNLNQYSTSFQKNNLNKTS